MKRRIKSDNVFHRHTPSFGAAFTPTALTAARCLVFCYQLFTTMSNDEPALHKTPSQYDPNASEIEEGLPLIDSAA
jgi:hypothetical protein